ncbi:MAG: CIA30 family protein [Gammaproteobacteria bacterium]|nr:CIA30 family protein [Gammaproteobacteria bacterium]
MNSAGDQLELQALPDDDWRLVTDGVMGGVSQATLSTAQHAGERCTRLSGRVSTANNGGFVQMTLDLDHGALEPARYDGVRFEVLGNGETYNVHLRTSDLWLPWQSYRATFDTQSEWRTIELPFSAFARYRTLVGLRPERLRRIGIVAIGREFEADLCIRNPALFRYRPG